LLKKGGGGRWENNFHITRSARRMNHKARRKKIEKVFRESEVLMAIEHLEGEQKMLAEGLDGKIESLGKRFGGLEERFDSLEGRFDRFENKVQEDFKVVKSFLSVATDNLDKITKDIKKIKAELKKINENKIDRIEFESLKTKVQEIEKELKRIVEQQKSNQKLNFA